MIDHISDFCLLFSPAEATEISLMKVSPCNPAQLSLKVLKEYLHNFHSLIVFRLWPDSLQANTERGSQ